MRTGRILTAIAAASLVVGGQALAQGRGGGQGGGNSGGNGGGVGLGAGGGGDMRGGIGRGGGGGADVGIGADIRGELDRRGIEVREQARANSRGPDNANERALERANENSVLAEGRTEVDLDDLRPGLVVVNSAGTTIGTIVRVNRTRDGRVVNVLVRDEDGDTRTVPIRPGTLSIDGEVVTTTAVRLQDRDDEDAD